MLFVPPQHGKSQIVSRHYPAWLLGKQPKTKIAVCSYSADLATSFNRDCQRIIDTKEYHDIFPDTYLNESNVVTVSDSWLRNSEIFETVKHGGFFRSVGVGGSLTGRPIDIGIIDDPVKDAMEAYSQRSRDVTWEWYVNVFKTRLHNDSQTLLTMTRWHEDDLAGRILNSIKETGEQWSILILPAIKENDLNSYDIRQIGEPLWPERHSLEKLMIVQKESIKTFTSLYQQRPSPQEGGLIKSKWLQNNISLGEFHEKIKSTIDYWIDTAYTDKTKNDPSLILATCFYEGKLYLVDHLKGRWEFPELIKIIPQFVNKVGHSSHTNINIEPKASGLSIIQQLRRDTLFNIPNIDPPKDDKYTRCESITPFIESQRVVFVGGNWDEFKNQLITFPNAKHDEEVDTLVMAIQSVLKESNQPMITYSDGF